ncbi:unnamed protein product [Bemisia tabaci]|uniref:Uncharacterized protein n=1 Tax=Bemisia tabaci TaxID=7038 RepID=A0A9P0CA22_BEMTA|nr:unnamed protein product [Bemisia tabaci]
MMAQVSEDAMQLVFLSLNGKITSINRSIDQGFPKKYLPHIQAMIAQASEGDIWADDKRIYIMQSKPDKEKLKRNVRHVITYLDLNPTLCPAKRIYYASNGDPSWDATNLISVVSGVWTLTHFVTATKRNLPVAEDEAKLAKDGSKNVPAQTRGERSTAKRYADNPKFHRLDNEAIQLEIEAEEVKRKYLEEKLHPRRHYHTKKGSKYFYMRHHLLNKTSHKPHRFLNIAQNKYLID